MTLRPIFPDGFLCVSKLGTQKNAPALDHIPFRMAISFRFLPHVTIKPRRAMVFYGILWDFGTFHRPSKPSRERFDWDPWVNIDETPSIPGHPRATQEFAIIHTRIITYTHELSSQLLMLAAKVVLSMFSCCLSNNPVPGPQHAGITKALHNERLSRLHLVSLVRPWVTLGSSTRVFQAMAQSRFKSNIKSLFGFV